MRGDLVLDPTTASARMAGASGVVTDHRPADGERRERLPSRLGGIVSDSFKDEFVRAEAAKRGFRQPELAVDLLRGERLKSAKDVSAALDGLEQRYGDSIVAREQVFPSREEGIRQALNQGPLTPAQEESLANPAMGEHLVQELRRIGSIE